MKRLSLWCLLCIAFLAISTNAQARSRNVILIHGAWHGGWSWHTTATLLESAGYDVQAPDLPGHGIDMTPPTSVTMNSYVDAITNLIDASPTPVVLVAHSMGGVVASAVAEARPEKVEKVIYLAAFVVQNGQSMFDWASRDVTAQVLANLLPNPSAGIIDINRDDIEDVFYGDCRPDQVTLASMLLRPNPIAPIVTPVALTPGRYGKVAKYYIKTSKDHSVSPAMQAEMIRGETFRKVVEINSDHSPFLSHPLRLHGVLEQLLRD
ncbi:MAG: alpha/beta fold hydrolase [Polyangiaceae bacterium]